VRALCFGAKARREKILAVRTVLQLGNPKLREVAARVDHPAAAAVRALVEDLKDTLAHWRKETGYGRGIAAPQLGVALRVIFLQLPGEEPWPMVNPEIIERSAEKIVVWDACLSFLSIFMQVSRHQAITVRYQDLQGAWHELRATEERDLSELLQHEIDHLDGVLAVDRITDMRTLCTREEFEKRYRAGSPYAVAAQQRAS
jgi:peptide deformylase